MAESAVRIIRTTGSNPDFHKLVSLLDAALLEVNHEQNAFFAQFNTLNEIHHVVLAYRDDQAIGCGAFKKFSETQAEIKRMFVVPAARKQGVAQKILVGLETWAKELGYASCVLETAKALADAVKLYERSGYRYIPNYGQYQRVESSVCLEKKIND